MCPTRLESNFHRLRSFGQQFYALRFEHINISSSSEPPKCHSFFVKHVYIPSQYICILFYYFFFLAL